MRRDLVIGEAAFLGMRRREEKKAKTARQKVIERQASFAEGEAVLAKFKSFLSHRCGNLVRAWRRELDPDGDGILQFTEFIQACRQMGFQGNLKLLWYSLDQDDTGDVSLEELDPEAVACFEDFTRLISLFFMDLDTCWLACLDFDHSGRCTVEEFVHGCNLMGYWRNPVRLHRYLDINGDGFIVIDHLEVLGLKRAASKEDAWSAAKSSGEAARMALEYVVKANFGGGLVHGWRRGFCKGPRESHLSEKLDAQQFCDSCRHFGYKGNLLLIWHELVKAGQEKDTQKSRPSKSREPQSPGKSEAREPQSPRKSLARSRGKSLAWDVRKTISGRRTTISGASIKPEAGTAFRDGGDWQVQTLGNVSFAQFLPQLYNEISVFRRMAMQKFNNGAELWKALLKSCVKPADAKLRKVEFVQAVRREIGFTGASEMIFEACDIDQENVISGDDFTFLQIGVRLPAQTKCNAEDVSQ